MFINRWVIFLKFTFTIFKIMYQIQFLMYCCWWNMYLSLHSGINNRWNLCKLTETEDKVLSLNLLEHFKTCNLVSEFKLKHTKFLDRDNFRKVVFSQHCVFFNSNFEIIFINILNLFIPNSFNLYKCLNCKHHSAVRDSSISHSVAKLSPPWLP